MAGDWIKMRGLLLQHPKLIALSRRLHEEPEFREWLTPGGGGPMNGQIVSDEALRCVTCALLMRVWSASREFGKNVEDDLLLPHMSIADLDVMASCPGFGAAMESVGWASESTEPAGVILPNFKQHNVPMTPAERQSEHRRNANVTRGAQRAVTETLREPRNKRVTREEERREEENSPTESRDPPSPEEPEGESGTQPLADSLTAHQVIVNEWNVVAPVRCSRLTAARRKVLSVRLRDDWWREHWREGLARIPNAKFMHGDNDRGWKADFDFFLQPDSLTKIIEGKYDSSGKSRQRSLVGLNAVRAAAESQGGGGAPEGGGEVEEL